jgi:hypothetical protein
MAQGIGDRRSGWGRFAKLLALAGAVIVCAGCAVGSQAADAYIYYSHLDRKTDSYSIGRMDLDGTHREPFFIDDLGGVRGDPLIDIEVDRGHIYWAWNIGYIGRATIKGTGTKKRFANTGEGALGSIALDSTHLYWRDRKGDIGRLPLGAGRRDDSFIVNPNFSETTPDDPQNQGACAMASNGRFVYWVNNPPRTPGSPLAETWKAPPRPAVIGRGGIQERSYSGSISDLDYSWLYCGIAASDDSLYWTDSLRDTLFRAKLDGSGAAPLVSGLTNPCASNIAGAHIYWNSGPFIGRALLNGKRAQRQLARMPEIECMFAVDSL